MQCNSTPHTPPLQNPNACSPLFVQFAPLLTVLAKQDLLGLPHILQYLPTSGLLLLLFLSPEKFLQIAYRFIPSLFSSLCSNVTILVRPSLSCLLKITSLTPCTFIYFPISFLFMSLTICQTCITFIYYVLLCWDKLHESMNLDCFGHCLF